MSEQPNTCEHEDCNCELKLQTAVKRDGRNYCSERCADHYGCDHVGCNCGVFPTEEPDPIDRRPAT